MKRVLLDESVPRKLGFALDGYFVRTVQNMAWTGTKNGQLLAMAAAEFDVFLTADQNLQYQQKYVHLDIGIIVLLAHNNRLQTLASMLPDLLEAMKTVASGQVVKIRHQDLNA